MQAALVCHYTSPTYRVQQTAFLSSLQTIKEPAATSARTLSTMAVRCRGRFTNAGASRARRRTRRRYGKRRAARSRPEPRTSNRRGRVEGASACAVDVAARGTAVPLQAVGSAPCRAGSRATRACRRWRVATPRRGVQPRPGPVEETCSAAAGSTRAEPRRSAPAARPSAASTVSAGDTVPTDMARPAASRVPQVAADAPFLLASPAQRAGWPVSVGKTSEKAAARRRRRAQGAATGTGRRRLRGPRERALLPARRLRRRGAAARAARRPPRRPARRRHWHHRVGGGSTAATGAATGGGCLRGGVGGGRLSVWVSLRGEAEHVTF